MQKKSILTNKVYSLDYSEFYSEDDIKIRNTMFVELKSHSKCFNFIGYFMDEIGCFEVHSLDIDLKKYILLIFNQQIISYVRLFDKRVIEYQIDVEYQYQGFLIQMLSVYSDNLKVDINLDCHLTSLKFIFLQLAYSRYNTNYITKNKFYFTLSSKLSSILIESYNQWFLNKGDGNYRSFFIGDKDYFEDCYRHQVFNP